MTETTTAVTPQQKKDEALAVVARLKQITDRQHQAAREARDRLHEAARAAHDLGALPTELQEALRVESVGHILYPRPAGE